MPSKTRMYLPGVPAHLVQRAHNRDPCCFAEDDFRFYCYIELNPVTACMVVQPEQYPWSSFRSNALGEQNELFTEHPLFLALGREEVVRRQAYRELFRFSLPRELRKEIADCLSASQLLGSGRFKEQVEAALGRKVGQVSRGRPKGAP
ncbi:hypothetical protein [Marinobacter mobilis]|uniref:Putative transposase n=1 Tax=Marinobacter mobilis TaxID=488533 RepID=A0A1H2S388_9GAMM|nr:hypothetical protein [Marinobacter mobilis]SDW26071.1 putative transposase [Marinobacter mobilis]